MLNDEQNSKATDGAASPNPVKQTEQKDPAVGPLRIDERELEVGWDGCGRYWQGQSFTGVEVEFLDNGEVYAEVEYWGGIEHGFSREWYSYPDHLKYESFSYSNSWRGLVREWYPNRQLQMEALYEKDTQLYQRHWDEQKRPHGLWWEYYPYKYRSEFYKMKSEAVYDEGTLLQERHWDAKGRLVDDLAQMPPTLISHSAETPSTTKLSSVEEPVGEHAFVRPVLDPRLTWEEKYANYQWTASEHELLYNIFFSAYAPPPYTAICYHQPGYSRFVANTLDEAKAACECHYATGTWE